MSMQAIEAILFASTGRIAVAVGCLLGSGFMIVCLIALSLERRRTRARSLIHLGTHRNSREMHLYSDDRQSETSRAETIRQDAAL